MTTNPEATTITVTVTPVIYHNPRSRRPLQDRREYVVLEAGRTVIKVTSRTEVARLVRRRYGADVAIDYVETVR